MNTPKSTPEEKNGLYKKAFDYARDDSDINASIFKDIDAFEDKYFSQICDQQNNELLSILTNDSTFQIWLKRVIEIKTDQFKTFENVKKSLDKKVLEQIDNISRNRGILVVSKDFSLVCGVVSYIWWTHPLLQNPKHTIWAFNNPVRQSVCDAIGKYIPGRTRFIHKDYSLWQNDEENIKQDLFPPLKGDIKKRIPLISHYWAGGMLFLSGLNNEHKNIFNSLLGAVRNSPPYGKTVYKSQIKVPCYLYGTLIVSTSSTTNLPEDFLNQFERIIELEPEKQKPAGKQEKQGNIFKCIGDMWQITLKDDHLQVKDNLYMKHIKYILEHPYKRLSLLELDKVFEGKQQTNTTEGQQKECMDILSVSGNSGTIEKQDNKDSKEYLDKKVKELKDGIEIAKGTGNSETEAELQAELDALLEHLSKGEYKTRISNRKGKNEASILKGINRCIDSIEDASSKANTGKLIANHIEKNIERLNYHIIYRPENQPNWNL